MKNGFTKKNKPKKWFEVLSARMSFSASAFFFLNEWIQNYFSNLLNLGYKQEITSMNRDNVKNWNFKMGNRLVSLDNVQTDSQVYTCIIFRCTYLGAIMHMHIGSRISVWMYMHIDITYTCICIYTFTCMCWRSKTTKHGQASYISSV